jgi:hypothetical protein
MKTRLPERAKLRFDHLLHDYLENDLQDRVDLALVHSLQMQYDLHHYTQYKY